MKRLVFLLALMVAGLWMPGPTRAADGIDYRILIPAIQVDAPIINLRRTLTSWSVIRLNARTAGHLEGTRNPGEGGNVVIAAHVETYAEVPGPFFKLHLLNLGDTIQLDYRGKRYLYAVIQSYTVPPDDLTPVQATDREVLTLITCAPDETNTPEGRYALRQIVRARLVTNINPGAATE